MMVRFVLVDPRHVLPSNGNAQPTMSNGGRSTCTLAVFDNPSHASFTVEASALHPMGFVSSPPE